MLLSTDLVSLCLQITSSSALDSNLECHELDLNSEMTEVRANTDESKRAKLLVIID